MKKAKRDPVTELRRRERIVDVFATSCLVILLILAVALMVIIIPFFVEALGVIVLRIHSGDRGTLLALFTMAIVAVGVPLTIFLIANGERIEELKKIIENENTHE